MMDIQSTVTTDHYMEKSLTSHAWQKAHTKNSLRTDSNISWSDKNGLGKAIFLQILQFQVQTFVADDAIFSRHHTAIFGGWSDRW